MDQLGEGRDGACLGRETKVIGDHFAWGANFPGGYAILARVNFSGGKLSSICSTLNWIFNFLVRFSKPTQVLHYVAIASGELSCRKNNGQLPRVLFI